MRANRLVIASLSLVLAVALAGCLRGGDSCLVILVEPAVDDDGFVTWTVTQTRTREYALDEVGYSVFPTEEGGPLARGFLDAPGPDLNFTDVAPLGLVTEGDVIRYEGASEGVGGIELLNELGVLGGTVRCR